MSKFERRNQAKQRRLANQQAHDKAANVFRGPDKAPRTVAVVPLCENVSAEVAVRSLCVELDVTADIPSTGLMLVEIERFKQKIEYIVLQRDLLSVLDACRVADFVVFVMSSDEEVDGCGETILKSVESQGISNTVAVVQVSLAT